MKKEDRIEGSIQEPVKKSNNILAITIIIILILLLVAFLIGYLVHIYIGSTEQDGNETDDNITDTDIPPEDGATPTTNQTTNQSDDDDGGDDDTCTDTCNTLGYECGNFTICGIRRNCGTCGQNETCVSGQCVLSCQDECNSEGLSCQGNMPYNCTKKSDGCFDRVNLTLCGTGYQCVAGACQIIPSCNNNSDCVSFTNTCSVGICNSTGKCQIVYNSTANLCRAAAAGGCDVDEYCTGNSAACPIDSFRANTYVCRAEAAGGCDVAELCSGNSAACPTNVFKPDGTACPLGVCDDGVCVGGCTPVCANCIEACGDDGCGGSCGTCQTGKVCVGGCCQTTAVCGDGTCNGVENCVTCPADCGVCPQGDIFYVDPVNGNMNNDGSYNAPWKTLQEVISMGFIGTRVHAGDTILLRNGYHGDIDGITGHNSDYITIAAQQGHNPSIRRIKLSSASKWIIRGLSISPEFAPGPYVTDYLVHVLPGCYDIIIENNNIFYIEDSSGWSAAQWTSLPARYSVYTQSPNVIIRNNNLKNVYFGIVIMGDNALVENNTIENIGGDGMVGSANGITFQYNRLKNFYKVDGNHDDGLQFHRGNDVANPIENIIVRGNIVINHEPGATNPLLRATPHGIVGFQDGSGYFRNFTVENNIILTQAYHGISLYGATNSKIINNIVFDPTGLYNLWISTNNAGVNTVVRNNMALDFITGGTGMTVDHNINIEDYGPNALFVNYQNHDMRHRAGSPAIDAGSNLLAPNVDILGTTRPQGSGYDIGAYEYSGLASYSPSEPKTWINTIINYLKFILNPF